MEGVACGPVHRQVWHAGRVVRQIAAPPAPRNSVLQPIATKVHVARAVHLVLVPQRAHRVRREHRKLVSRRKPIRNHQCVPLHAEVHVRVDRHAERLRTLKVQTFVEHAALVRGAHRFFFGYGPHPNAIEYVGITATSILCELAELSELVSHEVIRARRVGLLVDRLQDSEVDTIWMLRLLQRKTNGPGATLAIPEGRNDYVYGGGVVGRVRRLHWAAGGYRGSASRAVQRELADWCLSN
mmetsp:Transcript_23894/g.66411  ORF Transcript_23894/g.66411 Transcript_23894/m.66411 type:complete len:240 (-) Transcript_23894:261-980(-)